MSILSISISTVKWWSQTCFLEDCRFTCNSSSFNCTRGLVINHLHNRNCWCQIYIPKLQVSPFYCQTLVQNPLWYDNFLHLVESLELFIFFLIAWVICSSCSYFVTSLEHSWSLKWIVLFKYSSKIIFAISVWLGYLLIASSSVL